jgi:hypothetical protein
VEGIDIRVTHPAAKLRATVEAHRHYSRNLSYVREKWESLRSSTTDPARRKCAESAIAAQNALLSLAQDVQAPIERSLTGLPSPHWLDDVLSLDGSNAWGVDHMLPYFYQDWHCTGDFQMMRDRICAAMAGYTSAPTKLLLLGAGACGLVRDLAMRDFEVHAFDLSVPCLVLAGRLLRGETLDVTIAHKFERDWQRALLPGASPFTIAPQLQVANAARLPIRDASFPTVVTQYLLDIAPNPTQIIVEIARVLEFGGVWVNFGLPFGLSSDPVELGPLCDDALEPVLREFGFELISLERHACRLSDTGSLFRWPEVSTHWPQLSIARRGSTSRSKSPDVFQCFRAGTSDAIWNCKAQRLPGRLLRGGPGIVVGDSSAAVVRCIGSRADGRAPLSAIWRAARSDDPRLTEVEFVEVVRHLSDEGMIALAIGPKVKRRRALKVH